MKSIVLCFFLSLICLHAYAEEMREIELSDGSIITAEVVALSNGVYTVRSEALGTLRLEESKVRAIRTRGSGTNAHKNSAPPAAAQSIQERMMNDTEIMSMIQSLADDPEFKKVLQDPEMMKAVKAGDVTALMANPQFLKLLNNASVQDIQKKVK